MKCIGSVESIEENLLELSKFILYFKAVERACTANASPQDPPTILMMRSAASLSRKSSLKYIIRGSTSKNCHGMLSITLATQRVLCTSNHQGTQTIGFVSLIASLSDRAGVYDMNKVVSTARNYSNLHTTYL